MGTSWTSATSVIQHQSIRSTWRCMWIVKTDVLADKGREASYINHPKSSFPGVQVMVEVITIILSKEWLRPALECTVGPFIYFLGGITRSYDWGKEQLNIPHESCVICFSSTLRCIDFTLFLDQGVVSNGFQWLLMDDLILVSVSTTTAQIFRWWWQSEQTQNDSYPGKSFLMMVTTRAISYPYRWQVFSLKFFSPRCHRGSCLVACTPSLKLFVPQLWRWRI